MQGIKGFQNSENNPQKVSLIRLLVNFQSPGSGFSFCYQVTIFKLGIILLIPIIIGFRFPVIMVHPAVQYLGGREDTIGTNTGGREGRS